jgi:hypothetical protein
MSTNSSITVKGDARELPPLPPSPASSRRVDQQATVRHMPETSLRNSHHPVQREPSDEYDDDYDDQYSDYSVRTSTTQVTEKLSQVQLEDDLPDTTMLDSVILPAIASVGVFRRHPIVSLTCILAFPASLLSRSASSSQCSPTCIHRRREDYSGSNDGTGQRDRRLG